MGILSWAIMVVALVGLLDALYFVLVTYRLMRPDPRWLPPVCRMDEGTCARVVDTRYARVLGLPNAVYGVAWYVACIGAGLVAAFAGEVPFCLAFVGVSVATVVLSAFLAWSLLGPLKTVCPLCFAGHAINATLLVLLLMECF